MPEVLEKEVQVKDENDVKVNPADTGGEKEENPRVLYTMEELAQKLKDDPIMHQQFMKDEDSFLQENLKTEENASEGSKPEESKEAKPEGKGEIAGEDPKEIQVTINPKWLGDYGKGREAHEAVREMSKGNAEKDQTIEFYKVEKVPKLETELESQRKDNISLKKELETFKAGKTEVNADAAAKVVPKSEIVDLNKDREELLYTEEGNKKLEKSMDDLVEENQALRLQNESPKVVETAKEEPEITTDVSQPEDTEQSHSKEYSEIDALVASQKSDFSSVKPMQQMEGAYLTFADDLAKVIKHEGPYQLENGLFTEELNRAIGYYLDSDSDNGKKIRDAFDVNKMPALDLNVYENLHKIYGIRDIRNEHKVSYENAFHIYRSKNGPTKEELQLKSNLVEHESRERAAENRKEFAKETPANAPGGDVAFENITEDEFYRIRDKKTVDWTEQEERSMKAVHLKSGMKEEEFRSLYHLDEKKEKR